MVAVSIITIHLTSILLLYKNWSLRHWNIKLWKETHKPEDRSNIRANKVLALQVTNLGSVPSTICGSLSTSRCWSLSIAGSRLIPTPWKDVTLLVSFGVAPGTEPSNILDMQSNESTTWLYPRLSIRISEAKFARGQWMLARLFSVATL